MSNRDPEIEVAVLSEKGRREENQDWMSWSRVAWGELFIVADGMGGHKGGALAARMTVEGFEKNLRDQPAEWPFVRAFQEAARKTNEEVYRSAHSGNPETERMGSTVVVVLISNGRAQVGHIGDSRAYLFRNGKLRLLTKDHTTVQRMLDAGMLTDEEARRHPEAHILSRAVGSKPQVEIEISEPVKLETGDALMLCSDGLSGYVEDPQIERLLRSQSDVQRIPHDLVDLALRASGDDNITVQFIRYGGTVEPDWPTPAPPARPRSETGRITARLLPPPQPPAPVVEVPITEAPTEKIPVEAAPEERPTDEVPEETLPLPPRPQPVSRALTSAWVAAIVITLLHLPASPPAPRIALQTSSSAITPGESIEIKWEARNANQVRIEPGIGEVATTGSRNVSPTESVSFIATAIGTKGTASTTVAILVTPAPALAPTVTLLATPEKIKPEQTVQLEWKAQNANQVRIEPEIGEVAQTGAVKVTPTKSVSYVITAKGPGGSASAKVDIMVEAATATAVAAKTGIAVEPAPVPPTVSLTAKPEKIKPGQPVQLEWKAQNASQVRIEPEIGEVPATGSRKIIPKKSVSYVATVKGSRGTASAKVDVVVEAAPTPTTVALSAKPEKIKPGQPVQLEWKAQNASQVQIEPEIGEVPATGSRTVTPSKSLSYVITAKGPAGTASAKVEISVETAPVPPTIEFVAKPEKIKAGQTIQLEWKAQNANQVRIEPGIGEVPATGSRMVTPTASVSYVATATGPGGAASAKVDIVVEPDR